MNANHRRAMRIDAAKWIATGICGCAGFVYLMFYMWILLNGEMLTPLVFT